MSPRDIKYRNIAKTIILHPEYGYDEIAAIVGITGIRPRQQLYCILQTDRFKDIMTDMTAKLYDENTLRAKLNEFLNAKKQDKLKLEAIQLGMREKAMLTDKTINENRNYDATELDKIREKALQEAEESLRSVLPGVETAPQTEQESAEIEPKTEIAEKSVE